MALDRPTVMVTVTLPPEDASLETAMAQLGLAPEEVDADFGLVPLDPESGTYALLVAQEAGERVTAGDAASEQGVEGPFSNPVIEPFGPPE